jgi:hypothetical protein
MSESNPVKVTLLLPSDTVDVFLRPSDVCCLTCGAVGETRVSCGHEEVQPAREVLARAYGGRGLLAVRRR